MDIIDSFPTPPQAQYVGSFSNIPSNSPTGYVLSELQGSNAPVAASTPVGLQTIRLPHATHDWLRFHNKKGKQDRRLLDLIRICKRTRDQHRLCEVKYSTKHPEFNLAVTNVIREYNLISNPSQLDCDDLDIRGLVGTKLNNGCKHKRRTPKLVSNENVDEHHNPEELGDGDDADRDNVAVPGDSILMDSYHDQFSVGDLVFVSEEHTAKFIGKIKEFNPLGLGSVFQIGYVMVTALVSCSESSLEQVDKLVKATAVHGIRADMGQLYGGLRKYMEELDDYCLVCNKKYREGVSWIQCKTCQRWQHERCREGKYTNKWYYCWKSMDE